MGGGLVWRPGLLPPFAEERKEDRGKTGWGRPAQGRRLGPRGPLEALALGGREVVRTPFPMGVIRSVLS